MKKQLPRRRQGQATFAPVPRFDLERLEPRQLLSAGLDPASMASLIDAAVLHWQKYLGQPTYTTRYDYQSYWNWGDAVFFATGAVNSVLADAVGSSASGSSYSTTLTQSQGVDEADLIKTDGQRFYFVGGGNLVIARAAPASAMGILSQSQVQGSALALYLDAARQRVTVISQADELVTDASGAAAPANNGGGQADYAGGAGQRYRSRVIVTVFDVANPVHPTVVERTRTDGFYVDSRMVDDRLYLVVRNNLYLPAPRVAPVADAAEVQVDDNTYRRQNGLCEEEAAYRQRLADYLSLWQGPSFDSAAGAGSLSGALLTGNLVVSGRPEGSDLATIVGLDVGDNRGGIFGSATVTGVDALEVYASSDHLYLASGPQNTWLNWFPGDSQTDLYQFDLGAASVRLAAQGQVPGGVYAQWAMDEYAGYFRVVTAKGGKYDAGSATQLYVLQPVAGHLQMVGDLQGLGRGETIQAVRFLGDRAYVVTCARIDPLFPIDLSDPAHPQLLGELEVPGYSFFLQPLDATHLLGVGRQVGSEGMGMQVSLFDVSDVAHPRQIGLLTYDLSGWGVGSEAEYDTHALGWYPEAGILAVPMLHGTSYGYDFATRNASLEVIQVTSTSLAKLGSIAHTSSVRRSVRIDNVLYSLSDTQLKANVLTHPQVQLGQLDFDMPLPAPPPPPADAYANTGGWLDVPPELTDVPSGERFGGGTGIWIDLPVLIRPFPILFDPIGFDPIPIGRILLDPVLVAPVPVIAVPIAPAPLPAPPVAPAPDGGAAQTDPAPPAPAAAPLVIPTAPPRQALAAPVSLLAVVPPQPLALTQPGAVSFAAPRASSWWARLAAPSAASTVSWAQPRAPQILLRALAGLPDRADADYLDDTPFDALRA